MYTLLDGQAALALDSFDIKDMCTEGGEDLIFRELDQRFPDKVAAVRLGEAMEEAFALKGHENETTEAFNGRSRRLQSERVNLPSKSPRVHCLPAMLTWELGSSDDHVCNPQKLGVR